MNVSKKPVILQQYSEKQINNGGPATGVILLMNSFLKDRYDFFPMEKTYPFRGFGLKQFFYFYKTIKKIDPDIVHIRGVHSEGFWGVLAARLLKVKVVISVHGLYFDASGVKGLKRIIFKNLLEKFALQKADLVYCVCNYAYKREYIQNNAKELYGYIYNAAPNYSKFLLENSKVSIRKKYNIEESEIVISYVGRVTIDKGCHILATAIPYIVERHINVKFIIGGDGDYLKELQFKLSDFISSGNLVLLGKTSNVQELLLASDVFVFPSLHENLSNALLEAATVGLPIIATNVGGNSEIIKDGASGILIEPNNSKELIAAITYLLENVEVRNAYGENGKKTIKNLFSQEIIFEQISEMYTSILNNK